VKESLAQKNIPFVERDIVSDETAYRELENLGIMTTPVVLIDDQVIVGFDSRRIEELLGSYGTQPASGER
jgi:glutaredoxin 3